MNLSVGNSSKPTRSDSHNSLGVYAQDVRYFAIEHMDVRREASQVGTAYKTSRSSTTSHERLCSVSQEEYPTSSESRKSGFFKTGANRTPGYGYLSHGHAASPSMGRLVADVLSAHSLRGRYPHPGLVHVDSFRITSNTIITVAVL